ncbi:MAG: sugar ABC transporter substrate-binding protein [Actinobacteria bacterium]|nr:sugar ABC transporter substrate-binding protein [Actinomycetota bacterium]
MRIDNDVRRRIAAPAICLTAIIVLGAALAACGGSSSSSGGGGSTSSSGGNGSSSESSPAAGAKVIYSTFGAEIPFLQAVKSGTEAGAKEQGLDFTVSSSENDPAAQLSSFENVVAQQPEAIIFTPLDESAMVPPVKHATEDGIPVLLLASSLSEPAGELSFLGSNFTEIGELKANYLVSHIKKGGTVAMINGTRGLSFVEDQANAARKVFEKAGVEVVDEIYTKVITPDEGLTATENLITSHPEVEGIYFSGDESAVGGIKAIQRAGIPKGKIVIVGTDATAPAFAAIREGWMAMTLSQCAYQEGKEATQVVTEYLETGNAPESRIDTPVLEFTKQNIDKLTASTRYEECEGK